MNITIPPAALEAGARAAYETYWRLQAEAIGMNPADLEPWNYHDAPTQEEWRTQARAAFLAMIENWEGKRVDDTFRWLSEAALILPLTETDNAES